VNLPPGDPDVSFENSSLANLANGDFQEWQLGGEVSFPVGFRRGYAGVRNAQLLLAREKAVLEEQERQIVHDLSNAVADLDRAYEIMRTSYNRRMAALQNLELTRAAMAERPDVNPEQLLEAARRYSEADIQFQRALVEHMLAIKNVHFEKGTLLEYGRVQLSERVPPEALPPASPTANPPAPSAPPASVPPEGSSPLLPGGTPVPMSPPPATPPSLPPPAPAPAGGYAPPATPELTITVPPASAAAAPPVGVPPVVNLPDTYQPPQAIGARLPPREPTAAPAISTAMAPAAPIAAIPPREQSVLGTGHPPAMPREQSVLVPAYPAASATHAQPPAGTWPVPASVPGPVPQPATNWTAPPSVPASVPQPATNWSVPAPAPAPRPAAAESNRASPSTVPVAPTPGSPPAAAPPLKPTSLLPGGRLEWSREIRQAGFDSATSGQFAAPASYVAEAAVPPAGVALPAVAPASPENQLHRLPPVGAESENRSWRLPAP
jgi:hypothetical protein